MAQQSQEAGEKVTNPAAPVDLNRVQDMVKVLTLVITDPSLELSDNDIVNTAFGLYASLILNMIDILQVREAEGVEGVKGAAEYMRDASLEQVAKYSELLVARVPRRRVTVN